MLAGELGVEYGEAVLVAGDMYGMCALCADIGAGAGAGAQAGPHARCAHFCASTVFADSSNVDLVPRPSGRVQNERKAAVLPATRACHLLRLVVRCSRNVVASSVEEMTTKKTYVEDLTDLKQ